MSILSIIMLGFVLVIVFCQVAQVIISFREAHRLDQAEALKRAARSSTGLQIQVPGKGWVSADKYKA